MFAADAPRKSGPLYLSIGELVNKSGANWCPISSHFMLFLASLCMIANESQMTVDPLSMRLSASCERPSMQGARRHGVVLGRPSIMRAYRKDIRAMSAVGLSGRKTVSELGVPASSVFNELRRINQGKNPGS